MGSGRNEINEITFFIILYSCKTVNDFLIVLK